MIKVFYLINSMALGGAERQMAEIVRRLPRERFEPILCQIGPENAYKHLLPPDQPRYVLGKPWYAVGPSLLKILKKERPAIVHSFMEYSNFWARLLGPLAGKPIVVTSVRSRMMRPDYRLVEALLSTRCDAIVVNSVGTRDELVKWQRVNPSKIFIVRNIVDFERFKPFPASAREEAKKLFGLSGTVFFVPGRISVAKNQIGLVAATALGLRKGYLRRGDFVFLLAGRVYDSWVEKTFRASVKALALEDVFRYLGPVREVEKLYAAADFVVLPSLYEGLPNAALEAHACGLPLIMSRSANLDRIMEPGVSGFEFETLNVVSLSKALAVALRTSKSERERLGEAGRRRVLRMFDPDDAIAEVISLYSLLLEKRARGE